MSLDRAFFVQFPHPGGEHHPPVDEMPWNVAPHRRKFLVAPGRYRNAEGVEDEADLTFWGEWEPPSRIEMRWPRDGRSPRAMHRPYWSRPSGLGFRQNTDPWVWGDCMIYSNCKQITGPQRRLTSMQGLIPGSVICFGSTIDGEFCVDTVLVVASAEPWIPSRASELKVDDTFKICTGESITTAPADAHLRLTLYRGATADDPVADMFCFVPARLANADDPRFARPAICLPGLINPRSKQSTWGSKRLLPLADVVDAWNSICEQVLACDLLLGLRMDTPTRLDDPANIRTTQRERC